ncbi:AAA family ATPase [Nitrosospira sp. Is2]|uniref:AAA family ATPase n=1 Tax=Nitrosospira sp. Is2 TaxID=3080532 RepID=UPI0029555D8C|nr:AAA family ATPase [Nitrosospira sp. Is2]WON75127.1 AAA family ATPase [Nitrosospira sp. Is2]
MPKPHLNTILYGPPGTGKTYTTIESALEILAPEFLAAHKKQGGERAALKKRFDDLVSSGDVRFVTFHQSFSYEDFVEGLTAKNDENGKVQFELVDGVFKTICTAAVARVTQQAEAPIDLRGRRIWKMSLGNTQGVDAYIYDECIKQGYALLGYGGTIDFSGCKSRDEVRERFKAAGEVLPTDSYAITAVATFLLKIKRGDILVVSEGNSKFRAIGEVTGDYVCVKRDEQGDEYGQCRRVSWLRVYNPASPLDQLMISQFSQMTLYELRATAIDMVKLEKLLAATASTPINSATDTLFQVGERLGGYLVRRATSEVVELEKPNGKYLPFTIDFLETLASYVRQGKLNIKDIREKRVFDKVPDTQLEPYLVNGYYSVLPPLVERLCGRAKIGAAQSLIGGEATIGTEVTNAKVLIIDEINRGNVSRIFGELITLIEPSKRQGNDEALEVILPYSKKRFSVPNNVYLIGTMNTADRSLAGLDIALRRRFNFKEILPDYTLFDGVHVEGVLIGELLQRMNQRIEALLDRDHCIGHAYFLPLREESTVLHMASIFRQKILPLLQEYFFEDWERIRWVLNDHRKEAEHQFIRLNISSSRELFGNDVEGLGSVKSQWELGIESFDAIESYRGIIGV